MTYSEKLTHPLWQRKRLEILERDNFMCRLRSDDSTTLHIHHRSYRSGAEPWEYEDSNFLSLCKHCHAVTEYLKEKQAEALVCSKKVYNKSETIIFAIYQHDGDMLVEIYMYIEQTKRVEQIIGIKESTLTEILSLIHASEKLIPNAQTSKDRT